MIYYPRHHTTMVGLDIQPDAVRLVQASKEKAKYVLECAAMYELPGGTFAEGKIKNWHAVSKILLTMVRAHHLQGKTTVISLPAHLVRMQRLQIPIGMSVKEIENEIYAQIQRDVPGTNAELFFDYVRLEETAAYTAIYFAAARQDYIARLLQCVNTVGLKVKCVDVDILSLVRIVLNALPENMLSHALAVVYAATCNGALVILNKQEVVFHQHWPGLNVEELKRELKTTLQIYYANARPIQVEQLIVCADGAYGEQLAEVVNRDNNLQVIFVDPLGQFLFDGRMDQSLLINNGHDFLIACGAVMREAPKWSC